MLLSRLAENIYWAGRYLERAEDTARLVKVHTELYLDLPQATSMGWNPLLAVTGSGDAYDEHVRLNGADVDLSEELRVVTFLTTSQDNPSSVLSCLNAARANLRSVRALLPRSGWEQVNHLHLWARDTQGKAVPRRSRTEWANDLIRKCQTVTGLLSGTMSHDESYRFLEVGRHLERADMTTRVLDVQAHVLLQQITAGSTYADVTWMSVLKSLSAMQMFRRVARAGVSGSRALNFLLCDREFPRSVAHCLVELDRGLRLRDQVQRLPRGRSQVLCRRELEVQWLPPVRRQPDQHPERGLAVDLDRGGRRAAKRVSLARGRVAPRRCRRQRAEHRELRHLRCLWYGHNLHPR